MSALLIKTFRCIVGQHLNMVTRLNNTYFSQ